MSNEVIATGRTIEDVQKELDELTRIAIQRDEARYAYRRSVFEAQMGWRDVADYDLRKRMLSLTDLYARMAKDAKACGLSVKAGAA